MPFGVKPALVVIALVILAASADAGHRRTAGCCTSPAPSCCTPVAHWAAPCRETPFGHPPATHHPGPHHPGLHHPGIVNPGPTPWHVGAVAPGYELVW